MKIKADNLQFISTYTEKYLFTGV